MILLLFYMVCEIAAIVTGIALGIDMMLDTNSSQLTIILPMGIVVGLLLGGMMAFFVRRFFGRLHFPALPLWIATLISGWTVGGVVYDVLAAPRNEPRITVLGILIGTLPGVILGFVTSLLYVMVGRPRETVVGTNAPVLVPVPVPVYEGVSSNGSVASRPIEEVTGYNLPPRPSATDLERKLYEQSEQTRTRYDSAKTDVLTEDSETYTVKMILPGPKDQLVIYIICTEAYANGQPPEAILVEKTNLDGSNSQQMPYAGGILDRWTTSTTLLDIVDDVISSLSKMGLL